MSEETYRIFKVIFMFIILSLISCNKDIRYVYENEETGNYCIDGSCKRLKNDRAITHDINSFTYDITKDLCPLCVRDKDRDYIKSIINLNIKNRKEIIYKNRKALYKSLIKDGHINTNKYDFDGFVEELKKYRSRRDLYDNMKEDGYQDLGDWDEFNMKLGF